MSINLKQLSENLGLSQTTVSRALNGYPEVSEATRERVLRAADTFGYRPNQKAKGLATGRALAIGHVIQTAGTNEMMNPIFGDFIAGAGEAYSRAGYEMILSVVNDTNEATAYRGLKSRGAVDGVVLHGPSLNDPRIPLLHDINLPFVVHGRSSGASQDYDWIDVNNRRAFERATTFLIDLGHRRIGLINGLETMDFAMRRRRGYEDALKKAGLPVDPVIMFTNEMTEDYGYQVAGRSLDSANPPTAFVVSSMICGLGVRRAIQARGLRMGRDVSVIIHDDALSYLQNGQDEPIFTATRSSVREAGRRAAEVLMRRINNPALPPQHIMMEAELVVGQSTGPGPPNTPRQ